MRVFKFWASGTKHTEDGYVFCLWRGSNESQVHAQELAEEAVLQLALRPRSDLRHRNSDADYAYQTRYIPEELISSFPASDGSMLAAVTRNRYGALVLNAADMVIIDADIDFRQPQQKQKASAPTGGFLGWLFGNRGTASETPTDDSSTEDLLSPEEKRLRQIRETAARYPEHAFRIYRTHSGYRVILLDERLPPDHPLAIELLEQFRADHNYRNLCRVQQSYRARLTPKPFHLKMDYPPFHYPYDLQVVEQAQEWEEESDIQSQNYCVCHLVDEVGRAKMNPEVQFLLSLHDRACRIESGLPLA